MPDGHKVHSLALPYSAVCCRELLFPGSLPTLSPGRSPWEVLGRPGGQPRRREAAPGTTLTPFTCLSWASGPEWWFPLPPGSPLGGVSSRFPALGTLPLLIVLPAPGCASLGCLFPCEASQLFRHQLLANSLHCSADLSHLLPFSCWLSLD